MRGKIIALTAAVGATASVILGPQLPAAAATQTCHGKPVTRVITVNGDYEEHHGTDADDVVILRGSGYQKYFGEGGDDTICDVGKADVVGGTGNDWVSARRSSGTIFSFDGGPGNDTIIGSAAWDSIYGGQGDDVLKGLAGRDEFYPDGSAVDGGERARTDDADTVLAGAGNDTVTVAAEYVGNTTGGDRLFGGTGKDHLVFNGPGHVHARLGRQTAQPQRGGPVDHFQGFQSYEFWTGGLLVDGSHTADRVTVWGSGSQRVNGHGGGDHIDVQSDAGVTIKAGHGRDVVRFLSFADRARVDLGKADDTMVIFTGIKTRVHGGPGDDLFRIRKHHWNVPGVEDPQDIQTRLYGESGSDTMTWDCKAKLDRARHRLHGCWRIEDLHYGGMQKLRRVR